MAFHVLGLIVVFINMIIYPGGSQVNNMVISLKIHRKINAILAEIILFGGKIYPVINYIRLGST